MLAGNFRTRRNSIFTPFNKEGPSGFIQVSMTFFSRPAIFTSITVMLLLGAPVLKATHLTKSVRKHWERTATTLPVTKDNKSNIERFRGPSAPYILDLLPLPTR
jgi:hypothetical protein